MSNLTPEQSLQEAWSRAFIDSPGSKAHARQALDASDTGSETAAWSRWLLALAEVNGLNAPSARAFLHAARDWFVKNESARGQALCAELDAAMALQSGDAIRTSLIHRALDGASKQDQRAIDRCFSHLQRATFARGLGQWDLALRHFDAAWETAEISGNPGAVVTVRNQIGALKIEYGQLEEADTHCEAALSMAKELQAPEAVAAATTNLIVIRDALGDFEGSRAFAKALLDGPAANVPGHLARAALPLALSYIRAGEYDRADAWLEVCSGPAVSEGDNAVFWAWLTAKSLMQRNESAMAIDLCERIYAARKNRSLPFHISQLLETLAAAHEQLGHTLKSLQCRELVKRLGLGDYGHPDKRDGLLSISDELQPDARRSALV